MSTDLHRPGDPLECTRMIKRLIKEGYKVRRPTRYQIAVGPYNLYWTKGTITIGDERQEEKGFDAFIRMLPNKPVEVGVGFAFEDD